jgi:hypothetical protein
MPQILRQYFIIIFNKYLLDLCRRSDFKTGLTFNLHYFYFRGLFR